MLNQNLEYFGTHQLLLKNEELFSYFTNCRTNEKKLEKKKSQGCICHHVHKKILGIHFFVYNLPKQKSPKKETFSDAIRIKKAKKT